VFTYALGPVGRFCVLAVVWGVAGAGSRFDPAVALCVGVLEIEMPCKFGLSHVGLARIGGCPPGYIYIATYEDLCKIGCTKAKTKSSGIRQRVRSLRRKTGLQFDLVHILYFDGCIKGLEFALHKMFSSQRKGKDEIFIGASFIIEEIKRTTCFAGVNIVHIEPEAL